MAAPQPIPGDRADLTQAFCLGEQTIADEGGLADIARVLHGQVDAIIGRLAKNTDVVPDWTTYRTVMTVQPTMPGYPDSDRFGLHIETRLGVLMPPKTTTAVELLARTLAEALRAERMIADLDTDEHG